MERFGLSPLIRFTLISLYLALVLPLPLLAPDGLRGWMGSGLVLGLVLVVGLLSEQVETDENGLQVRYPTWIRWLLRRGWSMRWDEIRALVPVGTSQGGTVYYLKAADLRNQLLPNRVGILDEPRVPRQLGPRRSVRGRRRRLWQRGRRRRLSCKRTSGR